MRLEAELERAIRAEARKLELRHHNYHNWLDQEIRRQNMRATGEKEKFVKTPACWEKSRLFNPFYVHKHARSIARSISGKILRKEYIPHRPYVRKVPKVGGGVRDVNVYEIPDTAVSLVYYRTLMKKNRPRFSSYAYAYRNDRSAHYAVRDIFVDLKRFHRVFVAEYDFSKFFDNINHVYLRDVLAEYGFFVSAEERSVVDGFLSFFEEGKGIPQGTSLSLFLANAACWELDNSLEMQGVKFARYADDTLIWSPDYAKVSGASDLIHGFSCRSGVPVNHDKSSGISLLLPEDGVKGELAQVKTAVDFLGYTISVSKVGIRRQSVCRIKRRISWLIYSNLLSPLKNGLALVHSPRGLAEDRDLLVCLQQIRRYMYGNLTEGLLRRYLSGGVSNLNFKGLMSYYPLVTDEGQLKHLDGWLASSIYLALKRRWKYLGNLQDSFPKDKENMMLTLGSNVLYRMPSFMLIYKALKRGLAASGLAANDQYSY